MTREELKSLVNEVADQILGTNGFVSSGKKHADPGTASERLAADFTRNPLDVVSAIDHTNLKPDATAPEILRLCEEALRYGFATVCVHSVWVPFSHRVLRGSNVKVCTVVGFPSGAVPTGVKCAEAEIAVRNGAREVDMVLPIGMLRQGELDVVKQDIAAVAKVAKAGGAILKVILESAALNDRQVAVACALARLAGADFVKTSTGFHPSGGASAAAVALMRQVVGNDMGVKASGGIRSLGDALAMMAAGANRIGASASVTIAEEARR